MDELTQRAEAAAVAVGQALLAHGLTLATAESCTGGLIGHLVTQVSGSSAYYLGGVIAYANSVKEGLLGVSPCDLETHGAVSAPVALQMARGACAATGAQVGIAVTGIAGPLGGTPTKPVGTVYIGLATPQGDEVLHRVWQSDREGNKWLTAAAALEFIAAHLEVSASE